MTFKSAELFSPQIDHKSRTVRWFNNNQLRGLHSLLFRNGLSIRRCFHIFAVSPHFTLEWLSSADKLAWNRGQLFASPSRYRRRYLMLSQAIKSPERLPTKSAAVALKPPLKLFDFQITAQSHNMRSCVNKNLPIEARYDSLYVRERRTHRQEKITIFSSLQKNLTIVSWENSYLHAPSTHFQLQLHQ